MENEFRRRYMTIAAGLLIAVGLAFVLGGWVGVHDKRSVVEQIPYLASGGIGGLALVGIGVAVLHLLRQARIEQELTILAAQQEALAEAIDAFVKAAGEHVDLSEVLATMREQHRSGASNGGAARLPKLRQKETVQS